MVGYENSWNEVTTSKYTVLSFLPLVTFEQFQTPGISTACVFCPWCFTPHSRLFTRFGTPEFVCSCFLWWLVAQFSGLGWFSMIFSSCFPTRKRANVYFTFICILMYLGEHTPLIDSSVSWWSTATKLRFIHFFWRCRLFNINNI